MVTRDPRILDLADRIVGMDDGTLVGDRDIVTPMPVPAADPDPR